MKKTKVKMTTMIDSKRIIGIILILTMIFNTISLIIPSISTAVDEVLQPGQEVVFKCNTTGPIGANGKQLQVEVWVYNIDVRGICFNLAYDSSVIVPSRWNTNLN